MIPPETLALPLIISQIRAAINIRSDHNLKGGEPAATLHTHRKRARPRDVPAPKRTL